jgi:hypothetical protein
MSDKQLVFWCLSVLGILVIFFTTLTYLVIEF